MERHPLQERSIFNDVNVVNKKTSAVVQPIKHDNQSVKPLFLSPVLPGTSSITHNVTRLLATNREEDPDRRSPQETVMYPGGYAYGSRQELFTTPKVKGNISTSDGKCSFTCIPFKLCSILFCRHVYYFTHPKKYTLTFVQLD